jgi:3-hexulose-6-phosphate synthase/6-phospho-3-hexuloisomerase
MAFDKPILQVALDFLNLSRAVKVAREAVAGGADWIEAGTPLIKSEGLDAVRTLKKQFPEKTIVADMKIMDVGSIEVQMAAEAGAEVVMMLGVTDDSTISEGVDAGARYGARIMVDMINVDDMITRAFELERLGVDYVCVHVGIDQQMRGVDPLDVLTKVVETVRIPVAVAGGINSETAAKAVEAGASIVIVGGAITKAERAEAAATMVKRAMDTRTPIVSQLYKKYGKEELHEVFLKVSTPNISDAFQRKGEMRGLKPVTGGVKVAGKAVTVRAYPGDWAKPVEAIDVAKPGEVIVVEAAGADKAVWGELATWSCVQKKVGGVVIDGAIRDVDEIRALKFPAFAKFINPTAGDPKGFGEINVEILCGGVKVRPGDWVIADDNGVIVVPHEMAVEIANRSLDVLERENRIRGEIKQGSTLSKVLQLKKWEKIVG